MYLIIPISLVCVYFFVLPSLHSCARGKVIGNDDDDDNDTTMVVSLSSSSLLYVHKKITRSWDLGTSATRNYNESVEVGEKLASGYLESSGTAYKLHK